MSEPAPGSSVPAVGAWRSLDRRTVVVTALSAAGVAVVAGVPVGIALSRPLSPGWAAAVVVAGALVLVGGGALVDDVRWRRTRYRVLPDRFELRRGIAVLHRRSLNRDRIRDVDITASPLLRVFGLAQVKIGTGEAAEGRDKALALNPVTRADAEWLRRTLLDRAAAELGVPDRDGPLSVLDPRWARYAPMSFLTPTLGVAVLGGLVQVAEWFGVRAVLLRWVVDLYHGLPLTTLVAGVLACGLLVGVVGALAVFVEMWWNYRLDREPGGTLRVRRGLLTSRSLSVEERRLRGVELVEPLGLRFLRGARLDAVATGLAGARRDEDDDSRTLQPAAPREHVDRVAAAVLREPAPPTRSARLRSHPRSALLRRAVRALAAVMGVEAALVIVGLVVPPVSPHIAWIGAVVAVPLALALAFEAYRNLGHGLSGRYLVARHGAVRRTTVALRRTGVIGWTVRQSLFQRRRGLVTLTATTAAGKQAYSVYDADEHAVLVFAEQAVPGLLAPFLERDG